MAAAEFTENVILRNDASGLVVGFLAGDEVPEWAEGLTVHTTAATKPADDDADKGDDKDDDGSQSDEDAANEQAADDDADKGDAKPATRSRTAKK